MAPGSLLPHLPPARCAAVCVGVCFCVAGVSRDVAVFADMSPCPLLFLRWFLELSLPSLEGTGLLGPGWGPRARPPSPVSPQSHFSLLVTKLQMDKTQEILPPSPACPVPRAPQPPSRAGSGLVGREK